MRVIFLGPPGSGKGTQSKLLCQRTGLAYLGTGDMLREAIQNNTALGQRARPFVDAGHLVPDEVVNALIAERIEGPDRPVHFIIDGYPRTLAQANALDRLLESKKVGLTAVILIVVPDPELIRRLSGRGRDDDKDSMVRARLDIFHQETAAIAAYYRTKKILHEVPGVGEVEQVYNTIIKIVQS